jgi:leader peptidase (prepilin peptidase)/N-methyltransferase
VEALTAALAVACVAAFGLTADAALAFGFCAVLVTLSVIDVQHRIVPNRIVLPSAAIVFAVHTLIDPSPAWALGALGGAGFLFAAALAYPKGLGMGDVKLALLLGAMLGASVTVALFLGFVAALVPAVVLLARHGAAARKMAVPLVPFLSLGALVALFFGERLLDGYMRLFS